MFTPSNMLKSCLNARPRDMYDIVGALMGYVNADPAFATDDFEQAVKYVLSQGVSEQELFAAFDEEIDYEVDSSKWDERYYSYARVYLKDNFCKKRIAHVKAVARKLYPMTTRVQPTAAGSGAPKDAESKGVDSSLKKSRSRQNQTKKKNVLPMAVKLLIAVVIIVLLALTISLIRNKQVENKRQIMTVLRTVKITVTMQNI
jgi:hypothetical protein